MMGTSARIIAILRDDPLRWRLLGIVQALDLPDCWIGAGFIRNAVWDNLHHRLPSSLTSDVDVIWYDQQRTDPAEDRHLEAILQAAEPTIAWSVKNQARMHIRNDDAPYKSAMDAMRYWPETATAVAARRIGKQECEVAAPLGLSDLFNLILRPAGRFIHEKRSLYNDRLRCKDWLTTWPMLRKA